MLGHENKGLSMKSQEIMTVREIMPSSYNDIELLEVM